MLTVLKSGVVLVGAVIFFAGSFFNNTIQAQQQIAKIQDNQFQIVSHLESPNYVTFETQTKSTPKEKSPVVSINKNNGKVKISFRNKRENIEFDLEYDNTIAPADREVVSNLFKELHKYVSKKENINSKVKRLIKEFVNRKL